MFPDNIPTVMSGDTTQQCVILRQKLGHNVRHVMLHWFHLHICDLNDAVNDKHVSLYLTYVVLYFIPHYNSTCRGLNQVQLMVNYKMNFTGDVCLRKV